LRRLDVAARGEPVAHARRARRDARERAPGLAVDELRVDVLAAAVDRDSRPVAARDPPHHAGLPRPVPPLLLVSALAPHHPPSGPRSGLADLAPHLLAEVPDALALVRLGGTDRAQVRRELADLLPVHALELQHHIAVDRDLDPVGDRDLDRV